MAGHGSGCRSSEPTNHESNTGTTLVTAPQYSQLPATSQQSEDEEWMSRPAPVCVT